MASLETLGYRQELKRTLTLRDLVVYGMVMMVPISPFGVFGFVSQDAKGMVPLAYPPCLSNTPAGGGRPNRPGSTRMSAKQGGSR